MMKVICIMAVIALTCHQLDAHPNGQKSIADMSHAELMSKFTAFMHDSKEAAEIRELYAKEVAAHRLAKRQAGANDFDGDLDGMDPDMQKAEGFLDRAAKFVMEVVQRFLKWINTE